MRTTLFALALLALGCGSGDTSSSCPVFALVAQGPLYSDRTENLVEFGGTCTDLPGYVGMTDDMTVYLDGRELARDRWEVADVRSIRVFGAYKQTVHDFSVSYGCTARELAYDKLRGCGWENAELVSEMPYARDTPES